MVELMLNYDALITDLPLLLHSFAQGQDQLFSPVPVTCGQLTNNLKSLGEYASARIKARYNWRWDKIVDDSSTRMPTPANHITSTTWLRCDSCEAARLSTTAQGVGIPGHFNNTHHPHNITHTPKHQYTLPCTNSGAKYANGVDRWIVCTECNEQSLCGFSLCVFKKHIQSEYIRIGGGSFRNKCYQPECKDFPLTWNLALKVDGPASKWSPDDDEEEI